MQSIGIFMWVLFMLAVMVVPWLVIVAAPPLLFAASAGWLAWRASTAIGRASAAFARSASEKWVPLAGFEGLREWTPAVRHQLRALRGDSGIVCACIKPEGEAFTGYVRVARDEANWHAVVRGPTRTHVALRVLGAVRDGLSGMEQAAVFAPVGGCTPEACPRRARINARTHSWRPGALAPLEA